MQEIKEYCEQKKLDFANNIKHFKKKIKMVILQIGHVPASDRYVKHKIKDAEGVGIECKLINYPEEISEEALLDAIRVLNNTKNVTGIIVQLPLPKHISEEHIKLAIDPSKDIDGFHPLSRTVPATPLGIFTYLEDQNFEFTGKNAVILGRSNIVGKPMHKLLLDANMNVIMLHTKTTEKDKKFYLRHADLIIVATGHINTLTKEYKLKKSAVVIDVGINVGEDGKLIGDCERDLDVAFQSKVPGGCGLLTRLSVIRNLIELKRNY